MNMYKNLKQLTKNGLVTMAMLGAMVMPGVVWPASSVSAAPCGSSGAFLTLPHWHRGVNETVNGNCVVKLDRLSNIWIIVLNVIDILLQIVGYVAAGFVLYGGIRYVMSNGNPDDVSKAKDTIVKALIGMIVAMSSAAIVGFIVNNVR